MIKNYIIKIIIILISLNSYAQKVKVDNNQFELDVITAKKLSRLQDRTLVILESDKLKTIFLKVEMTSMDGTEKNFDINKFILLDTVNKLKIRLIDVSYQQFTAYIGFEKMTKRPHPFKEKGSVIKYDPSVSDSFEDYDFENFQTCEIPINYGKRKKPDNYILYFEPEKFISKKLILIFPFQKNIKGGVLYYGYEKVSNLEFK